MAIAEIPQAELNPALIDPYDQVMLEAGWQLGISGPLPSPAPIGGIGWVSDRQFFSQPIDLIPFRTKPSPNKQNSAIITLPVDSRGWPDYQLEPGLAQFQEAVDLIADHEHQYYPGRSYDEVRLVLDQSFVKAGYPHRPTRPNQLNELYYHRDPYHRAYSLADCEPTIHVVTDQLVQGSDLPRDCRDELPHGIEHYQADPYEISQSGPLSLHASNIFTVDAVRTFCLMRYTFAS